ncbi:MAG: type II secretion system F family protein [Tropheryma whipplei]|uniref:type II secretion system F family protein n=1 Tax=Tropheryma whipplei TaxID=2039 RepID=UPI000000C8BE|nr:type II secretion system F family protein [Tropheryma whipplei]MCO8183067.1 type II secretion system F family protein [Tropheryma whipplei]MCO8190654.1 type II secretion system F family protein [Tropheryma whipplei]CAD67247.1 putative membrane protein [Tropheryma whipplei TW08/27]
MIGQIALSVLFAVTLGCGIASLTFMLSPVSTFRRRLTPYLSRLSQDMCFSFRRPLYRELFGVFRIYLNRFYRTQPSGKLAGLLEISNRDQSVVDFRITQIAISALLTGVFWVLFCLLLFSGQVNIVFGLLAPAVFAGSFWCIENNLRRYVKKRKQKILNEMPSAFEFLSLSVSAGEGVLDAIKRICFISKGEFSIELKKVLIGVSSGDTLERCLKRMAAKLDIVSIDRAVSQIITAIERGTPLADILIKQAKEARNATRVALIEQAGKKEIAMMFPLVFFILPVTILFAIFPGIQIFH